MRKFTQKGTRIIGVVIIVILIFIILLIKAYNFSEKIKSNVYGYTNVNSVSSQLILGSGSISGNQVFTVYIGENKDNIKMIQFDAEDVALNLDDAYKDAPYVTYEYQYATKQYSDVNMYISEDSMNQSMTAKLK